MPSPEPNSGLTRGIHRVGIIALTGGTIAASTTIWPVLVVPAGMFLAGRGSGRGGSGPLGPPRRLSRRRDLSERLGSELSRNSIRWIRTSDRARGRPAGRYPLSSAVSPSRGVEDPHVNADGLTFGHQFVGHLTRGHAYGGGHGASGVIVAEPAQLFEIRAERRIRG